MATRETALIVELSDKDHQIQELSKQITEYDKRINELTTAAAESMVHTGDKEVLLTEMEEKFNKLEEEYAEYKKSCSYEIMPDRIESGTFALCVFGCGGKVKLENVSNEICNHLIKIFKQLKSLKLKKLTMVKVY